MKRRLEEYEEKLNYERREHTLCSNQIRALQKLLKRSYTKEDQEWQKNEMKKRRIAELEERCNRQQCTISDLENDIRKRARQERQKNARKKSI